MRVRILKTTTVGSSGVGGLPQRKVLRRQTLTVGSGYDLPDDVAKDLVARGLAARVEAAPKPDPEAIRDGRRARVEVARLVRENGDLRSQLAERDDELATAREEIARLRAEPEGASGAVEDLEVAEVVGAAADDEDEPEDAAVEAEPASEPAAKRRGRGRQAKAEESASQE